jgi:hypothetical protein
MVYVEQLSREYGSMMRKLVELQRLTKRHAEASRVRDANRKKWLHGKQPCEREWKMDKQQLVDTLEFWSPPNSNGKEAAEREKGTRPWHWSHILAASLNMVWEQLVRKRTVWPDAFKAAKKKFEKKELNHRLRNGTVLWDSKKNGTYDLKRIVARFYDRVGGLEPEEGERVLREVLGADITEAVNSDHD